MRSWLTRNLDFRIVLVLIPLSCALAAACGSDGDSGAADPGGAAGTGGAGSAPSAGGSGSQAGSGGGFQLDGGELDASDASTCGASNIESTRQRANVLLLIDRSGSMTDQPGGFSVPKWDALGSALTTVLPEAENELRFGLQFFPFSDSADDECGMPSSGDLNIAVDDATASVPAILSALEAQPTGGTPTADALARAFTYYTEGAGKDLSGGKYVLLATDGGPNCAESSGCAVDRCTYNIDGDCPEGIENCCEFDSKLCLDDGGALARVQALRAAGISTFVVGFPGTEAYAATLSALADAGGLPNPSGAPSYYAVSASGGLDGLVSVFSSITTSLITSCRLQLTSRPPAVNKLNVVVDGVTIAKGDDGWTLDSGDDPPTVVLQGTTCAEVETRGAESVQITYGCPTLELQ